jgi:hypothetical protein
MDASVNMKMSPDEHRTIVSALQDAKERAIEINNMPLQERKGVGAEVFRAARERVLKIDDLLKKL